MRKLVPVVLGAGIAVTALAQQPDAPISSFPYTPGLDPGAMDRATDPCVDFYQYACGGWIKANPIPADQSKWEVYSKLNQDNLRFLWGILDDLSKKRAGRNPTQQKIGDHFGACMDEAAVEKLGATPLQPLLRKVGAMKSKSQLPGLLAELHLETGDSGLFFGFGSNQDFQDSNKMIAFAVAGGLGLPDRDYYTKDDARSQEIRAKYLEHVARMFVLLGDSPEAAARNAAKVMAIEAELAKASLTRVESRDPYNLFHKYDYAGLKKLTPGFDWSAYFKGLAFNRTASFNVTEPKFFGALEAQLGSLSLDDIKTYLRWHLAHAAAPYLSDAFVRENFAFYSKTLRGVPELKPRWKRCVALVDGQLGEALGQEFVRRAFGPELKARTLKMTQQIERAMEQDIQSLDWMSPQTKKNATAKLHAIVNKIGYPDKWRDYSSVAIKPGDFYGNVVRAQRFESRRDLNKIGRPVDRGEWFMTPPSVNAYYNPQMNDINFAAGILQPPLFDPKMDDAPNYGNTGGTIGHELTHGFDDEGRKYDAKGNLTDWWTAEDGKRYEERAQCIVDQYSTYTIVDDIKINGKLTNGEDIADLGGLMLAWMAWKMETQGQKLQPVDGLTPEQRFFVGNAQWACGSERPESLRVKAITDPHSPVKYRVNGLVVNMPQFQEAFQCKTGQPMAPARRCRVW
jgi:endothelin-converting enzyme/putative endopeptidase